MDEIKLIALYYYICECYDKELWLYCQRHSKNNLAPDFSDQELLTIYLFAMIDEEKFQISSIHQYAMKYLHSWFPKLPSYQAFNRRLNELADVLWRIMCRQITGHLQANLWQQLSLPQAAVDSVPLILAQGRRSDQAKVACEIADKGRCASKGIWYHGLKLHWLTLLREGQLPLALDLRLSAASDNDNIVFKEQLITQWMNLVVFADKIYDDVPSIEQLLLQNKVLLLACQRRRKGQGHLRADQKILSRYVSRKRQPIESFFNWLIETAKLQWASKVRSLKGLLVFIYGKVAAAFLKLSFYP